MIRPLAFFTLTLALAAASPAASVASEPAEKAKHENEIEKIGLHIKLITPSTGLPEDILDRMRAALIEDASNEIGPSK